MSDDKAPKDVKAQKYYPADEDKVRHPNRLER